MLIAPAEWIQRRFGDAKSAPSITSVRRWLENGDLPGKKIGGRWYVDIDAEMQSTGDELADRVLRAS